MVQTKNRKGETPPAALQEGVRRYLAEHGERHAVEQLGVSRQTLARLAGGLPCQRATIAATSARLGLITVEEARP